MHVIGEKRCTDVCHMRRRIHVCHMRRRIHVCHMRRRIHVCQVRSDVLTAEVTLILRRNIALTVASKHSESGQQGTLPDREIVSISIFNSGAANHDMHYPNDQFGTKISSRWASIVFAKAQDARDVIELYGGGGEQAVRFPSLFEKNILHLWPLYRIVADAAVPFPPFLRLHFQPSRTAEYDIRDTCWGDGTTLPLGGLLRCRLPRERSRKGPYSNAQRDASSVFACGVRVEFVWSFCTHTSIQWSAQTCTHTSKHTHNELGSQYGIENFGVTNITNKNRCTFYGSRRWIQTSKHQNTAWRIFSALPPASTIMSMFVSMVLKSSILTKRNN